jgi:hypothetical protein
MIPRQKKAQALNGPVETCQANTYLVAQPVGPILAFGPFLWYIGLNISNEFDTNVIGEMRWMVYSFLHPRCLN